MKTFAISAIAATLFTTAAMASTSVGYTQSYDGDGNIQVSDTATSAYQGGTYRPAVQGQSSGCTQSYDGNGNIVISDSTGAHRATVVSHNVAQPVQQTDDPAMPAPDMFAN